MSDMLEFGREVLKAQPFSALLGAEMTRFEAGLAELTLPLSKDLTQQHGFAHGGVLAYLADNAMTFAGGSVLGNVLTQEIKINYTRPAKGECLVARATVLSSGRSQAVVRCDVFAVSGTRKSCAPRHRARSSSPEQLRNPANVCRGIPSRHWKETKRLENGA